MKILLTGGSGFLGKIIQQSLSSHEIITIGRHSCDFCLDISNEINFQLPKCDLVIHAAGKAHSIPKTKFEKDLFFKVNVQGTNNLLNSLDKNAIPKSFVFISSVAVYGLESGIGISETYPLMAKDPYGRSKIEAENIVMDWCRTRDVQCTLLRLPLLVGKNAPGNLGNMVKAIRKRYYFNIGGGKAKKSMVLAKDIAEILPWISNYPGIFNLTDGYHPCMSELANLISKQFGTDHVRNIPFVIARGLAFIGDLLGSSAPINSQKLKKIRSSLIFDDSKARTTFNWHPDQVLENFEV